jgi:hypothetical protein
MRDVGITTTLIRRCAPPSPASAGEGVDDPAWSLRVDGTNRHECIAMTSAAQPVQRSRRLRWLPYILSLPALIVCIDILIPFVTAVYYSMLRYRLNLPALKGFIWFNNYISFLSDPEFWNTVRVSLLYTGLTVGVEVPFGLAIALLLQRRTLFNGNTKQMHGRFDNPHPRVALAGRSLAARLRRGGHGRPRGISGRRGRDRGDRRRRFDRGHPAGAVFCWNHGSPAQPAIDRGFARRPGTAVEPLLTHAPPSSELNSSPWNL